MKQITTFTIISLSLPAPPGPGDSSSSSSSDTVQGSVYRRIIAHGGVHDSYTFQCGLVGSFTSPGIDTR